MILCPLARRSSTQDAARSGEPISSIISIARLGAPPWSGPLSAPTPATRDPAISAPVLATTRLVKVDALNPWSSVATRYLWTARTATGSACPPVAMRR